MEFTAGDYLIGTVRDEAGKSARKFLFKMESIHKGIVTGTLEKNSHIPKLRVQVEVPKKDVILNLGPDPAAGKVYGTEVGSLYKGRKTHEDFGALCWFYTPEKETRDKILKGFSKAYKTLKANGLDYLIDPTTCLWEVHPYNGGKYAGMYLRSANSEKMPHRFQIHPECQPLSEMQYVIHHELGHHWHYEFLKNSTKLEAKWVRLFNSSIKIGQVKAEDCKRFLTDLLAQEDRPSDFKSNLSEEDTEAYKLILRTISQQHGITAKELDLLWEADYRDDLQYLWPKRVTNKELAPVISEYACKNYKETIAEAFSYHLTGKKLPKEVVKLLEKSLSYTKTQRG
ncbi:hypothetical protein [Burkholderia phage BCSR5]|nr:hypothetical protein [Burkholderia phage BCSR5]